MNLVPVWLEATDGRRWPVAATCSLGRSTSNDVVIEDGGVSRRHALIHRQDEGEFWIIDLGSGNGTFLNERRITLSTRLNDGDRLQLGDQVLVFRQATAPQRRAREPISTAQTIINIRSLPCWLLVADIKGSSGLAARLSTTEMAMLAGRWLATCKEIVEAGGGTVNKYLGDGFLAFWRMETQGPPAILPALQRLMELQRQTDSLPFRLAVHYGNVTIGGAGSLGEDSLSGLEVIYVFRMEKLASSLGSNVLTSEAARQVLGAYIHLATVGAYNLPGIDGPPSHFYAVQ